MKASLIIPFYKDLGALELILQALCRQSAAGLFEVVIAEDDDAPKTVSFLNNIQPQLNFPVQHISQPDEGYRRSKALNNGLRIAKHELVIFTDGDCIPHRHFIQSYLNNAADKKILYGRRVNMGEKFSTILRQTKDDSTVNYLSLLLSDSSRVAEGLYLPFYPASWISKRQPWGCNMGAMKKDLFAVNGFDEDYREWGPEDLDICKRLERYGCTLESVKYKAIIYHLYHRTKGTDEVTARGMQLFEEKRKEGKVFCSNGIIKTN